MGDIDFLNGQIAFNVLAKTPENARQVQDAAEGHALIGVTAKEFPAVDAAVRFIAALREKAKFISVGLGGGDPAQWEKVLLISKESRPDHINQVFPLAAYTQSYMKALGQNPLVNAMVSPTGTPGRIRISTGPLSKQCPGADVDAVSAMSMIRESGVRAVKLFPVGGAGRLDEVAAAAKAAASAGIEVFEPTGGINESNFAEVLEVCLESGVRKIIPHVYSSIVDGATGLTMPESVANLLKIARRLLDRQ